MENIVERCHILDLVDIFGEAEADYFSTQPCKAQRSSNQSASPAGRDAIRKQPGIKALHFDLLSQKLLWMV